MPTGGSEDEYQRQDGAIAVAAEVITANAEAATARAEAALARAEAAAAKAHADTAQLKLAVLQVEIEVKKNANSRKFADATPVAIRKAAVGRNAASVTRTAAALR